MEDPELSAQKRWREEARGVSVGRKMIRKTGPGSFSHLPLPGHAQERNPGIGAASSGSADVEMSGEAIATETARPCSPCRVVRFRSCPAGLVKPVVAVVVSRISHSKILSAAQRRGRRELQVTERVNHVRKLWRVKGTKKKTQQAKPLPSLRGNTFTTD